MRSEQIGFRRGRASRAAWMLAMAVLAGAGGLLLPGLAQAAPGIVVSLTAVGTCGSGPNFETPNTTLSTANITRSAQISISGSVTGLTPGHHYYLQTDNGNLADGIVDLGSVGSAGDLTLTNVLDGAMTQGYQGTGVAADIYDTNGAGPATPVASTDILIPDNCSRLIANTIHDRLTLGTLRLIQQGDGNLVLYEGGRALWNSKTGGHPGAQTVLQGDGNLVTYSPSGKALWSSRTNRKPSHSFAAELVLQTDKNLVLYQVWPAPKVLWATYTN